MGEADPVVMREYERIAETAARQAVQQSFEMLFGIDVHDRSHVMELREDMMRMRRLRKMGDRIGITALIAITSLVVSGAASFFWDAIKNSIKN